MRVGRGMTDLGRTMGAVKLTSYLEIRGCQPSRKKMPGDILEDKGEYKGHSNLRSEK